MAHRRSTLCLPALLALLASGRGVSPQQPAEPKRPEVGAPMPDLVLVEAATGRSVRLHDLLAAPPSTAPLVLAFLHKDKDLCGRFLGELAAQVATIGEAGQSCSILTVFAGEERDGGAIAAAKALPAPFRVHWDPERSAHGAMGLIAFPTVYVVDRKTRTIALLRRGYKVSLAQEVAARLEVALGLMTEVELAQLEAAAPGTAANDAQSARHRQAEQLLRTGKVEAALAMFAALQKEAPADTAAQAGAARASARLDREDAYQLLLAARALRPDDRALDLALGEWFLQHGRLDEAEPLLRQALEHDPAAAWFALGTLHERRGAWQQAAQAYRESALLLRRGT